MSEEDAELVRAAFETAQDLEQAAQTYWHPEVEYVEDPRWPGASRYQGREAVLRCFQAYFEDLGGPAEEQASSVERVIDAGDRQVPFVRFSGRSASGVPHEHLWAYVVEVREGQITYFRAYYEPQEALEAVGWRNSDA